MNAIFEPTFLEVSHGSRPNKGNHTALKFIKQKFSGVKGCVEADIYNNFSSISHNILIRILKKRISFTKFLSLIKRCIKAGYKEKNKFYQSNIGLFQGNIISPILNNIYLPEFDLYMSSLAEIFNTEKTRKKNPTFRRIQYQMRKLHNPKEIKRLRNQL